MFQVLKTERLHLRQVQKEDIHQFFKLRVSPETNTFIKREIPENANELFPFIEKLNNGIKNNHHLYWAIIKENQLIGTICLWNFSNDKLTAEVGYELHADFHKKGFMSEALQSVINLGFQNLNLKTIEAFTHKNNIDSIALLEKHQFVFQPKRRDKGFENNRIFKLENNN